jgi:hypothetical protein
MQFDVDAQSVHADLFMTVRQFMLENYDLSEIKKDRITTYSDKNGGICHMRTMKYGVDVGFLKGVRMKDDLAQLSGSGKLMRVLAIKEFDKQKLKYFFDQAIMLNAS